MITKPITKTLSFEDLFVDPAVQRALNEAQAAKIAEDFRPEALGVLVVSHRDNGRYHVIDGQTRRAGAIAAGRAADEVQCQVYEGLTLAEEAAMFRLLNDRRSVSTIDKFLVRVIEGEAIANQVAELLEARGWHVAHARGNGKVQAIAAIETVYRQALRTDRDHAISVLRAVIGMITDAYGHDSDAMRAEITQGLGLVVAAHRAEADLPKLMREMAQHQGGPLALVGKAKGLREMRGGRIADNMADVLIGLHNKQKRLGRLPQWRSE